jgi:O-antigen/teichoic acid export membrane protein
VSELLRKTIFKALLGFVSGMMTGLIIMLIEGSMPDSFMGANGIPALVLYLICCGLLGAAGLGCQFVYEIERYSLTLATLIHFIITMTFLSILGLGLGWDLRDPGIWIVISAYVAVYFVIWLSMYIRFSIKVRKLNKILSHWKETNAGSYLRKESRMR